MAKQSATATVLFVRSLAAGVLLSMAATYLLHLFGSWKLENYRPDPDTTSSVVVYNTCAVFDKMHTLRPNYPLASVSNRIDQTKLTGSFLNFFDGHVPALVGLAFGFGLIIFALRKAAQRTQARRAAAA